MKQRECMSRWLAGSRHTVWRVMRRLAAADLQKQQKQSTSRKKGVCWHTRVVSLQSQLQRSGTSRIGYQRPPRLSLPWIGELVAHTETHPSPYVKQTISEAKT